MDQSENRFYRTAEDAAEARDEIETLRQELAETKAELAEVGQVATEAVNVLLAVGAWGLHGSKQNDLWAEARGLHARLTGRATTEKPRQELDEALQAMADYQLAASEAHALIEHLAGLSDLAYLYGVTKQAVANWIERYTDFPKPILTLSAGRLWDRRQVTTWRLSKAGVR